MHSPVNVEIQADQGLGIVHDPAVSGATRYPLGALPVSASGRRLDYHRFTLKWLSEHPSIHDHRRPVQLLLCHARR